MRKSSLTTSSSQPELTSKLQEISELGGLRLALSSAGEVHYHHTSADDRIHWSDNAEDVFSHHNVSPISSRSQFVALIDKKDQIEMKVQLEQSAKTGDPFSIEYQVRDKSDNIAWVEDRGICLTDKDGKLDQIIGLIRFVTERKEEQARLIHLAVYDELTGQINRNRLRECLAATIENVQRSNGSAGFLVAAVDDLSLINENYGFETADEVIVEVSRRLNQHLHEQDVIGRISGNKFGILLAKGGHDVMMHTAKLLQCSIRETVVKANNTAVSASISVGCIEIPNFAESADEALANAEEALSRAKSQGRDRSYAYFLSDGWKSSRHERKSIADQIMSALKEERIVLAYQPIVDAKTGKADHFECLVRIHDNDGKYVPAGVFIPVAEQLGLIRILDRRVVEMAVAKLEEEPNLKLAINVSALTATDPSWYESSIEWITKHKAVCPRITIEITETVAIQDLEESARFISRLKDLGCKIAIDDFGAGYTSFRNLQLLDIDTVKIDGSFVRGLNENTDNKFFVRTLIELAQHFKIQTVAEWVECEEEVQLLKSLGVDFLQGFHLGKPETDLSLFLK